MLKQSRRIFWCWRAAMHNIVLRQVHIQCRFFLRPYVHHIAVVENSFKKKLDCFFCRSCQIG